MQPGFALDAGCGHGSEAIWLAASGWQVTAVDLSATALDFGRSTAHAAGADVAERIEWVEGDLGVWTPPRGRYDLVSCLYVHVAGSVVQMVRRLGTGSSPAERCSWLGSTPATGAPTPAAAQVHVSVDEAVAALDPHEWDIAVAEERPRAAVGTGVDAVVRAIRVADGPAPVLRGAPHLVADHGSIDHVDVTGVLGAQVTADSWSGEPNVDRLWMANEPMPSDTKDFGPFFHGTKADLKPGELPVST